MTKKKLIEQRYKEKKREKGGKNKKRASPRGAAAEISLLNCCFYPSYPINSLHWKEIKRKKERRERKKLGDENKRFT